MRYCPLYPRKFLGVLDQTEMKSFQLEVFWLLPNLVQGAFYLVYAKNLPDVTAIVWPFRSQPKVMNFPHACEQRFIF